MCHVVYISSELIQKDITMSDEKPKARKPRKPRTKRKKAAPKTKAAPKIKAPKITAEKPTVQAISIKKRNLSDKELSLINQLQTIFAEGYTVKMVTFDREKVLKLGSDFIGFMREYEAVDFVCSKAGFPNRCIHAR